MTRSWYKLGLSIGALVFFGAGCTVNLGSSPDGGVFVSTDHGTTWKQHSFVSSQKNSTVTLNDVTIRGLAPLPSDGQTIYLATRGSGVWKTVDSGNHWTATGLSTGDVTSIALDPQVPTMLYAAVGSTVKRTVDAGKTWTTIYTESQADQQVMTVALNPQAVNTIWAFTSGGKAVVSTDGGQTWAMKNDTLADGARAAWFDTDGSGRMYVFLRTQGIVVATADGSSWTNITAGLKSYTDATTIYDVSIGDPAIAPWYIATGYGLLRSTDRGVTWTPVTTLTENSTTQMTSLAVNMANPSELFVATGQKLQHTTNGGLTWSITSLPTKRSIVQLRFQPQQPDRLWFGTFKKK